MFTDSKFDLICFLTVNLTLHVFVIVFNTNVYLVNMYVIDVYIYDVQDFFSRVGQRAITLCLPSVVSHGTFTQKKKESFLKPLI